MLAASAVACVYGISTLCLVYGLRRNRSELLLPWLIVDMIGILLIMDLMILFSHGSTIKTFVGGPTNYWLVCAAVISFDVLIWLVVHAYYLMLCRMKKMKECAVITIPYFRQLPPTAPAEKDAMLALDGAAKDPSAA